MTTAKGIEEFCSYFEREAASIARVTVNEGPDIETGAGNQLRYRKMLYVTAIDTLAGLRFHKSAYPSLSRRNRDRFFRFLKEYGSWPEGDLVSLPFLKDELQSAKLLDRPLGRRVTTKMSQFSTEDAGTVPITKMDIPLSELLALATTEREEEAVTEYRHLALFYRYRNSLVHESRQPGTAMDGIFGTEEPSYHSYIDDSRWYLLYPVALFEKFLKRSILGFRGCLVGNQIDPYSLVEDKARW